MANITEHLIKNSDNVITLTLTEDGSAISGPWTRLEIWVGGVEIQRTSDANGVALTEAGVLTIRPAKLTEDLSALTVGRLYPVEIVVVDSTNTDGATFGGPDSSTKIWFEIGELPA